MKKTGTILILAIAALGFNACSGFLNVPTLGKSTIDGFFADMDGLRAAGTGLHRTVLEFYDDCYLRFGDISGDTQNAYRMNANEAELRLYDFDYYAEDNSGYPYTLWKKAYVITTNANNILYYGQKLLSENPSQEAAIKTYFGYAYFARALAIFDLCNVYAMPYGYTKDASHLGVVAITYIPSFDDALKRHTVKECYDQVISDLEEALKCFGSDDVPDPTYFSGLACEALLARVYLYMKDYDKAAQMAAKVMAKAPLTPADGYVNMFRKAQDNPGEAILRMNSYNSGTGMRALYNPTGSQDFTPSDEFLSKFDKDDVRLQLFTYVGEEADGEAYAGKSFTTVCKYLPVKTGVTDELNRRCDPFVLRASEMYLIHAEALCNSSTPDLAGAAADIRALRARALGKKAEDINIVYTSARELDSIIQEERCKELCFEGHRFFDLKRRGENVVRPASTTSTCKQLSYPDNHYALPISQMEMQANENMIQNEGYTGRKSLDSNE